MKKTIKNASIAIIVISNPSIAAEVEILHSVDFHSKSTVIHSFSDGAEVSVIKTSGDEILDNAITKGYTP